MGGYQFSESGFQKMKINEDHAQAAHVYILSITLMSWYEPDIVK